MIAPSLAALLLFFQLSASLALEAAIDTNGDASSRLGSSATSHALTSGRGELSSGDAHMFIPAMKSFLSIQIPAHLHNKNGEGHKLANFGLRRMRGAMSRYVYFTEGSLCEVSSLSTNNTYPKHSPEDHESIVSPFFVLAQDRGDCTPVRMARNAQEYGASALILGERWCRCEDKECTDSFPSDAHCLESDPPLVDDGSAMDVTIPTVLLHKKSSQALYNELKAGQPAWMELVWGLPMSDEDIPEGGNVESIFEPHYHLWSSAHDPLFGAMAYKHLRTMSQAFGHSIHFSPRFFIQDGTQFGCPQHADKSPDQSPCDHLCTNHGRYCASHAWDLSGHAVVRETLRRLCIHQHYPAFPHNEDHNKKTEKLPVNTAYFDYVIYHLEHCADPHKFGDEECVEASYRAAKINKADVEMCMKDTGHIDVDTPNSLLDEMLEKQKISGVVEIPSITINNRRFVDKPSARTLFTEICTQFWETTVHTPFHKQEKAHVQVPKICEQCGSCPNVMGCLDYGKCVPWHSGEHGAGHSGRRGHGWTIFFFLVAATGAGGAWYYYKKREEGMGFTMTDAGANLLSGDGYMQMNMNTAT